MYAYNISSTHYVLNALQHHPEARMMQTLNKTQYRKIYCSNGLENRVITLKTIFLSYQLCSRLRTFLTLNYFLYIFHRSGFGNHLIYPLSQSYLTVVVKNYKESIVSLMMSSFAHSQMMVVDLVVFHLKEQLTKVCFRNGCSFWHQTVNTQ